MEPPVIPNIERLKLVRKPDCPIPYTLGTLYSKPDSKRFIWLIFVNGLGLPQAWWQPTLQLLQKDINSPSQDTFRSSDINLYATTFDRYGQGLSQPTGEGSKPEPHDLSDSILDMCDIVEQIRDKHLNTQTQPQRPYKIILVGHSIGVPLARTFFFFNPHPLGPLPLAGALFLDSNIANIDMVSLLPDPQDPDLLSKLPADTTTEDLNSAREMYKKLFSPSAPNSENLNRTNMPLLLPNANQPLLQTQCFTKSEIPNPDASKAGQPPTKTKLTPTPLVLRVVAHDPDTFAEESLKICTRGLTEKYIEPAWQEYNKLLLELDGQPKEQKAEVVVAKGAGHFVQRDNPRCVADQIWEIVGKISEKGTGGGLPSCAW